MVDYFGAPTPLNQLAGVSVSGPQSLVVTPYDKSAFKVIETAIMESGLGLMPTNEGRCVRLRVRIFSPSSFLPRLSLSLSLSLWSFHTSASYQAPIESGIACLLIFFLLNPP